MSTDFLFRGTSLPAATAVDFTFALGKPVTGWRATSFGTPAINAATGFMPVTFGPLVAKYNQFPQPAGWQAGRVGTPHFLLPITGWQALVFGAPPVLILRALGFAATKFGVPLDLQAAGFKPTHLGAPTARQVNRDSAWRAVTFGTPAVAVPDFVACDGFTPARFGRPTAIRFTGTTHNRRVFVYAGLRPVKHFGVPHV